MIRNPVVAGQFYPGSPEHLKAMIKGMVDETATREEVIGLVLPHAGYVYSGPVAAAVVSRIEFKDTFIIMGPNHTGMGKPLSIMTGGTWKTPLGEVQVDAELGKQILTDSSYLEEDRAAHQHEHSIEVQLPFLQYFKPDIKIVPIILAQAGGEVYQEIGRGIAKAVKDLNKKVVIIASSDMSHYESQESASSKDIQAIEAILSLDGDELLKRVRELNITMCGYAPAMVMLQAANIIGAAGAELVRYATSGDVTGNNYFVSGSNIFQRKPSRRN